MRLLHLAASKYRRFPEDLPDPAAGSVLQLEQWLTSRAPTDTLVASHRSRAREYLERIFDLMIDEAAGRVVAYPFSIYALVRASIESLATALWLIRSDRRRDRVLRTLQLSYRNAMDALSLMQLTGPPDLVAAEEQRTHDVIERLNEIKDRSSELRQRELGYPPKYTDILKAVSPKQPGGADRYEFTSPINVWKMSSAFLHGSEDVSRMLSDVRQMSDFQDGIARFEITPKMQLIASCVAECVNLHALLDERTMYLSTHDYGGRSVVG